MRVDVWFSRSSVRSAMEKSSLWIVGYVEYRRLLKESRSDFSCNDNCDQRRFIVFVGRSFIGETALKIINEIKP